MNIGYLYGFNSYPPKNGGGVHVYNLVECLTNVGCKIHVFEPEENPQCKIYPANDRGIRSFVDNIDLLYIRIDGWYLEKTELKLKCMELATAIPTVWEINGPIEERLILKKELTESNSSNSFINLIKSKISNMKLLSSIKNENNCRRKYAEQIKAAICVSEENAQYAYNELGIKDCRVIPNGSDPARFSPDQYNKSLYDNYDDYFKVIYIGDSQYPWQGFQYVKGLAEMARQKGDKFLFIALDNSSSGLTVENDNLLRYKIDYLDVPMYVASADACLCLYAEHEFSIYKYGFNLSPLKLFDYMASGKPVIGTHVGQIKAVIDDGKDGLLTTNNLDDIYEKLLFCFNNQSKAKQMGRLAREKIINNYNWMKIAQTTHDLFASLQ